MAGRPDVIEERRTLEVGGQERSFLVVRPAGAARPGRVLLALHGSNSSGAGFRRLTGGGFDRWAGEGTGVVVYPDSWRRSLWNDARASTPSKAREAGVDDVAFLRAVAAEAGGGPVSGVGFSNGGQMVIRAVLSAPPPLAAAALLSATVAVPGNLLADEAAAALPVLMAHGTRDPLVPYEGGTASLFGFRPRGEMRSARASARFWAARNGIEGEPSTTALTGRTTLHAFAAPGRPPVRLLASDGGGHVVPGPAARNPRIMGRVDPDLDLPALVLAFFEEVEAGAAVDG